MGQDSGAWERLDQDHQNRMQDIDARYQALDEQAHSYWNSRQRSELDDRRREFEEEWERRRNEEGEHLNLKQYLLLGKYGCRPFSRGHQHKSGKCH